MKTLPSFARVLHEDIAEIARVLLHEDVPEALLHDEELKPEAFDEHLFEHHRQ